MHSRRCKASCVGSSVMFAVTPADGLCCAWLWCPEIGTGSIDWAQLITLLPEDEVCDTVYSMQCVRNTQVPPVCLNGNSMLSTW
jgi:hypothetical protein